MHGDVRKAGARFEPEHPVGEQQKKQPERPREIDARAEKQVQSAHATKTPRKQHQGVLQVSLTPAPIASGIFDQVLRGFLVTSFKIVSEPDLPVFFEQQRGLDKIVAQNRPTKWFGYGQMRQFAMLHEGCGADNRIMAPVIPKILHPEIQTGNKDRRVQSIAELLQPAKE